MSREKQIDIIRDLLVEFDEMGFVPSVTVPDHEAYAIKWRAEITKALVDYFKQSENVIELPCNIGDSCYPLPRSRKPIVERKVSRITFSKRNVIIGYYENDGQYRPPLRTRTLGEDVFLTKSEAEAKMKGGAE